jgi:hypothetical protein
MEFDQILKYLPKHPEMTYQTKRGTPGISYKFQSGKFWVTLYVTGTDRKELPTEVAAALAVWSLLVLAERATGSKV